MQIPFLVNVGTTLGSVGINVGGVGGLYFTIPLGDAEVKFGGASTDVEWTGSAGIMIGAYAGKKLGPGTLFVDLRYAGDFVDTKVEISGTKFKAFKRGAVELGIGYLFQL